MGIYLICSVEASKQWQGFFQNLGGGGGGERNPKWPNNSIPFSASSNCKFNSYILNFCWHDHTCSWLTVSLMDFRL